MKRNSLLHFETRRKGSKPQCLSYGDALSSDDHRIILQCCAVGQTSTSARCCSRPPQHIDRWRWNWQAHPGDDSTAQHYGRTAQRLARAGCRRYSGGILLSILTFHNCGLPKNSIRLPAQHDGRSSTAGWGCGNNRCTVRNLASTPTKLFDVHLCSSEFLLAEGRDLTAVGLRMFRPKIFKTSAVQVATLITGHSALNLIKLYRGTCKDEMSSGTGYDAVQTGIAI
jgi:hypothetical protein